MQSKHLHQTTKHTKNPCGSIVSNSDKFDKPPPIKKSVAAVNEAKNNDDENEEEKNGVGEKSSEESKGEKETEKEQENSGAPCTLPPVNDREAILYPWSVWSEINLPVQKKSGRKITHCGNCKDCDIIFGPLQITFI